VDAIYHMLLAAWVRPVIWVSFVLPPTNEVLSLPHLASKTKQCLDCTRTAFWNFCLHNLLRVLWLKSSLVGGPLWDFSFCLLVIQGLPLREWRGLLSFGATIASILYMSNVVLWVCFTDVSLWLLLSLVSLSPSIFWLFLSSKCSESKFCCYWDSPVAIR
jgi:hypothetical protein